MLFPGQGAQYPGMGKAFCEAYPEADALFDRANEILGFDLKNICFHESEEQVNRTDICQPGILTTSLAILEVLKARHGLRPECFHATAGLSLGEYTALVFSGVLGFDEAVDLVAKRGRYMQEDSNHTPSGMMTLVGADRGQAERLCREAAGGRVLVAANFLAPEQVAISGEIAALDSAEALLKGMGIRRGIRLKVAGAFHSPLMREGGEKLKGALEKVPFRAPVIPFASNVTGSFVEDPEEIRHCLGRQVTSPVRWSDTMGCFLDAGLSEFYEPGPGKSLSGILKKRDRSIKTFNLDAIEEINGFVDGLGSTASTEEGQCEASQG
jgi:[acyl-carrier-protein] S-malonyltransferase